MIPVSMANNPATTQFVPPGEPLVSPAHSCPTWQHAQISHCTSGAIFSSTQFEPSKRQASLRLVENSAANKQTERGAGGGHRPGAHGSGTHSPSSGDIQGKAGHVLYCTIVSTTARVTGGRITN